MKTWRIKLVKLGHATVPFRTALLRYVLAWGWVFPALVACYAFGLTSKGQVSAALAINVVLWGMTALARPQWPVPARPPGRHPPDPAAEAAQGLQGKSSRLSKRSAPALPVPARRGTVTTRIPLTSRVSLHNMTIIIF